MERTREQGTIETVSQTPSERINAVRRVVNRKQYAKIDGQMADLFTCSLVCQIFDALNPENQAKFSSLSYPKMAQVAFRLTK